MDELKYCPRCKEDKPRSEFPKDRSRPDGLYAYCKACNYANSRKWAVEHKEHSQKYQRDWKQAHLDEFREGQRKRSKQRYREQRDLFRQYVRQRRARKRGGIPVTLKQIGQRVAECGSCCVYCGGAYSHIDHIFPVSRGGHDVLSNLVPACATCNLSKGRSDWRKWFRQQTFYSPERETNIEQIAKQYLEEYPED